MRSRDMRLNSFRVVLTALLLLPLWGILISANAQQEPQQSAQGETLTQNSAPKPDEKADDSASAKPATNQAMSPEEAREAQFVADSQKLYQLAQELKVEVAKSNKNTLSIAVTKKAEEIEKLAKSMKERMRKE